MKLYNKLFDMKTVLSLYDRFKDKAVDIDIKTHREKRSLSANAYAWALIGKIADVLRASKEEIYLAMLKRYGQSSIISVLSDVDIRGYIKYYEDIGTADLGGKSFTHYKVYKGSSEYNTKEMSIFIDGIVSEAKDMDIETMPPAELERIKSLWNIKA